MAKLSPPENYDFMNPSKWNEWKQRFSFYRTASKLHKDDGEIQVATLIYTMGQNADNLLKSFNLSADDSKKFEQVLDEFDKHFNPKKNVIHERAKFHSRRQNQGDTAESFIRSLYELFENCAFPGDTKNEQIRDKIVIGILDTNLSEKMQLESELTLEKAVQMARQSEIVKGQVKAQHDKERGSADEVSHGARPKQPLGEYRAPKQNPAKKKQHRTPMPKGQKQCTRCNRMHIQGKCPAKGKNCRKCGKMDHFSVCCRTKTLNELAEESDYLGTIETGDGQWRAKLKVRHLLVCFKIDTGADVTVIPETVYLSLGSPKLKKTNKNLFGPGNKKLNVLGSFTETLSSQNKYSVEEIYVVRGIDRSLLGRPAIIGLNLVKLNIDEVTSVDSIKRTHPRLFRELGQLDGEYRISLNEGVKPFALAVPRRVPIPLLPKVKAELERMEKSGVIFKVDQSTDWCAGIVCVQKAILRFVYA
ncbi:uncharacterized protein K02A2.6-like [Mercenaria mercenaria]|uniref:uncharacterized protein K02A2.6-like n=1 Tax=Mercenaria mercenaria TaxID=6596 RepID=UPI00234F04ED|nr:uncharacterized protein K02A2.6-like [Mercenaria mercenaria]